jgi:hypothetical protein
MNEIDDREARRLARVLSTKPTIWRRLLEHATLLALCLAAGLFFYYAKYGTFSDFLSH